MAYFHLVNASGGVHGRKIVLESVDDGFECLIGRVCEKAFDFRGSRWKAGDVEADAPQPSPAIGFPRRLQASSLKLCDDEAIDVEVTLETGPAVLYDALAVPGGHEAAQALGNVGHALEFIKDQYRHCKPILALGDAKALVENAGVSTQLESGEPDPGMLLLDGEAQEALPRFIEAIAKHRHFEREMDPPAV